MSNLAVGLVGQRARAKGSCLLVLIWIADGADDEGRFFWGTARYLADKSRLSLRGLRYILAKLKTGGEITEEPNNGRVQPRGSKGYIPDRFLHVRCIAEWDVYQQEGPPAKFAGSPPAKFAATRSPKARQSFPGGAVAHVIPQRQDLAAANKEDLLVDLLVRTKAAPAAPIPPDIPENQATFNQLEAVVHETMNGPEGFDGLSDFTEAVKVHCGQLQLLYHPPDLARAIASVTMVRGFERRATRRVR